MDLVAAVNHLRVSGRRAQLARHQPLVLLWAIGRAEHGLPRLVNWSEAQDDLKSLLLKHGLPRHRASPEYPFIALAHTDLWELVGIDEDIPHAHGSRTRSWLNKTDPAGGLRAPVYQLVSSDAGLRALVVDALIERFFRDVDPKSVLASVTIEPISTGGANHVSLARPPVRLNGEVREISLERRERSSFVVSSVGEREAIRHEAALLARYVEWLGNDLDRCVRNEITIPGEPRLYTDLFDRATRELVEVKGDVSRDHVRMALGQIVDYARFVNHERLAALFPRKPSTDLITLLASQSISCIYETAQSRFNRLDP